MLDRFATAIAGAALAALAASAATAQTVTLRVASFAPPMAKETQLLDEVFSRIVADSEGTLAYQMFPGGTLQPDPTVQLKLVEDGVADAAFVISGFQRSRQFPDDAVLALPDTVRTATEGALAMTHLIKQGMLRGYEDGNFIVLGAWTTSPMYMQTTFPVETPADLKGRKFQVSNPVGALTMRTMGAVPVANIPVTGVSEALSRGVVDGTLGDWTGTFAFRVVDAADYHVDGLPLSLATAFVPINKATWERIPEAGKAAIEKHSGEAFARLAGAKLDGAAEGLRAQLDTMPGHTVVTLEGAAAEPFRALADEAVQSWIAEHPNGAALHAELTSYLESLR